MARNAERGGYVSACKSLHARGRVYRCVNGCIREFMKDPLQREHTLSFDHALPVPPVRLPVLRRQLRKELLREVEHRLLRLRGPENVLEDFSHGSHGEGRDELLIPVSHKPKLDNHGLKFEGPGLG